MEKVPYLGETLLRWRTGQSTFLALPEKGARLMNWNVTLGDGTVRDVLYWPEDATLTDIAKVRGGNPILFPFSGRCFDQGEIFHWRGSDGVKRPMPIHGLARQGAFKLTHADARGFTALFLPNSEAQQSYPFDYEFTVTYLFEPFGLMCELAVKNLGTAPLPWSAGHHFYFTVPWSDGLARSDYLIRIPAAKRLKQDQATGRLVAGPALATDVTLANPALIDTFHTELKSNEVRFGEKGRPGDVVLRVGTEKTPRAETTFVTWTAADDSPFYCVEPWMGPANAPGHKVGLQFVRPGEIGKFVVSVHVQ